MESNGDKLVANRLKNRGMSWSIRGVERLAKVIHLRANGELAQHCQTRSQRADYQNPQPPTPRRSGVDKRLHDRWLLADMPAFTGPHATRPWVKGLHRLTHYNNRLN